jgi:hypothetical protein
MSVQVGKLTVHAASRRAGCDASFRVRAEAQLRALDMQHAGLPERAILIVRRLELGVMDRTAAQRVRAALDETRRAAERPAFGPVGASARAVLFGDQVELLACLTTDLVHGTARERWYWRQICPTVAGGRGAALAVAWLRDVRWLPGCLARLSEPESREAVSLLSPQQSSHLLTALLGAFGSWPPTSSNLSTDAARGQLVLPHQLAQESLPGQPGPAAPVLDGGQVTDPPWRQWLPATDLHPHAEALLGTALALHYAPALVRRPTYSGRLAAWQAAAEHVDWQQLPSGGHAPGAIQLPRSLVAPESLGPPGQPSSGTASADAGMEASAAPVRDRAVGETLIPGPFGAPHPPVDDQGEAGRAPPPRQIPVEPSGKATDRSPWTAGNGGIVTGLASLLFLVNFVVWLDTEEDTLLPTGWALVELLGRHLLGAQFGSYADDPLWDLLAELDGRSPGSSPAVEFDGEEPLRLPQAWLRRWPPPDLSYVAYRDGDRLIIRHQQAGFVAADVPCPAGRFDDVLAAQAAWLGGADTAVTDPVAWDGAASERRFEQGAGAFVSWLLSSGGIGVSSLTSPGRVLVTSTHVDVVFSLEDINLAIRAAGLDQDPGWVPQLGRIVLFHFL